LTITTIRKSTKYFPDVDNKKVEPEVEEKVLSEFKTTNDVATTILNMLKGNDFTLEEFNKKGDIEFSQYIDHNGKVEEIIIIKFSKV
jgi:hypothetical protein